MSGGSVWLRIKALLALLLIMFVDIAPVPIVGLICLYILLFRPAWFKDLIERLYL